ncbi:MAG: AmmeMemoRadiSam system protein A [Acidobacteriota bacterium]|jgi:AmmeMemoRadiSam system protein A
MSNPTDDAALAAAAWQLPNVGREAIRAALENRAPERLVEAEGLLAEPSPVFVTLRIDERLRGCIGSLVAIHANMVEETEDRARAAAFDDPRFRRLTLPELDATSVEVSILRPLVPVTSVDELDPARFGIEIRDNSGRRAVLLPEIDGIVTVEQQIKVTRQKAGIPPGNELTIRKFTVVKVPDPLFATSGRPS